MAVEQDQCGSCGEPIYWLTNERTGKIAPIEVKTTAGANVAICKRCGTYCISPKSERDRTDLHLNHFVTCPQAKTWHKRGGRN